MSPPTASPTLDILSPGGSYRDHEEDVPTVYQTDLQRAQEKWKTLLRRDRSSIQLIPQPQRRPIVMTVANTRVNHPWGDELIEKTTSIVRVYASNVNGIRLDDRGGQFDTLCKVHKEVQADIVCGQEHNLDTTQVAIRTIL